MGSLLSKKLRRKLRPVFATEIERTLYPLHFDDSRLEFVLDEGAVRAARKSQAIRELEVELKEGDPAQLFEIARVLSERAPLRLTTRSKAARGYDLFAGSSDEAVKARAISLPRKSRMEEAFQIIASACLAQIADNHDAVLRGDPEGVHQLRLELRRPRAAGSLFSPMPQDKESRRIKSKLKWLTNELRPARLGCVAGNRDCNIGDVGCSEPDRIHTRRAVGARLRGMIASLPWWSYCYRWLPLS